MKKLLHLLAFLLISIFSANAQQPFTTFQSAQNVMGQPAFTTTDFNCSAEGLNAPGAMAISSQGMVAIAERSGRRVKIWKSTINANGTPADVVIGKPDFTTCSSGGAVSQSETSFCEGVAFSPDGNKLIISDYGNNRILIWNSIPTTNGQPADVVLGQVDFISNSAGTSSTKLKNPTGLCVSSDGRLLAIDYNNQRILIWNSIPTVNGAPADVVIGQGNFSTSTSGNAINKINFPYNLQTTPDGKLLVADTYNHRVLIFNTIPIINGASADLVIGHTGFSVSTPGTAQNKLTYPYDCAVSPEGKLAITDYMNNRTLIYNKVPTLNGANADLVLGQSNFTSSISYAPSGTATASNMRFPNACEFDSQGRLFVSSVEMNRVLLFGNPSAGTADLSVIAVNTVGASCAGNDVSINFTATNNSAITATGVKVQATLPNGLDYISITPSIGTYDSTTKIWTIGSFPANSSATLAFVATTQVLGSQTVTAEILSSHHQDNDLSNNTVTFNYNITATLAPPTGDTQLTRCGSPTIANLTANGSDIKWYSMPTGGTVLDPATPLVNAASYFASQTIAGCESTSRLRVTVSVDSSVSCNTSTFQNFQPADYVIGQSNFSGINPACSVSGVFGVTYTAISSKGVLAIAEQTGGKIKLWKNPYGANGSPADVVLGKPDFTSCSTTTTPSQSGMHSCDGVAFSPDGTKFIASDSGNNRVLIWNSIPTTNGQPADVVLGQETFTTNTAGTSKNTFNYPSAIFVSQDGRLFISDYRNNRVLVWNSIPTTNKKPADLVIGQNDFTTATSGNSDKKLFEPWGIWVAPDGKLLVGDSGNHRVLVWNSVPVTNGAAANVVIGQNSFNVSTSGTSVQKLRTPTGVTVSVDGKLAIGDFNNRRVMIYNSIPQFDGMPADVVLGQPDFDSAISFAPDGVPSNRNMAFPYNVAFDLYGRLFVVGRNMNRGMVFGKLPTEQAELSIAIASSSSVNCSGDANTITITLKNDSPISAEGVVATASFPNSITYTGHLATSGTFNPVTGYWTIGTVPANTTLTLTITGITATPGNYTANASILHSNQLDPNMENNGAGTLLFIGNSNATGYAESTTQTFCAGATIANLAQSDTVEWFSSASGGTALPTTTVLENGMIYFAAAILPCVEIPRTAVTATVNAFPETITMANLTACDVFKLPVLNSGNYFSGPGGTGTMLLAGDEITQSQIIYIFSETATIPNCTVETSFTVTINPFCNTAAFYLPDEICEGDSVTFLPYDDNAATGTWSPPLNNMETTTYTWTPDTPGFHYPYEKTIIVNQKSTPTFDPIGSICPGTVLEALPETSLEGISGTWSPVLNNLKTTTYTFTPNSGQCALETTMTIAVEGNVTPVFSLPNSICKDDTLMFPLTSNNNIAGIWSPALNNQQTTTYTFTPTSGQCAVAMTMTIMVNTVDTTTSLVSETISSNQANASYQWINCNGNSIISGAMSQSFTATQNGDYAVIVSFGNCSVTSECVTINTLGIETSQTEKFSIYPNPTASILYLKVPQDIKIDRIVIFDVTGKMVMEKQNLSEINVGNLESGVYIIHAYSDSKLFQDRFIKK